MWRNGLVVAALLLLPAMSYGQLARGPWEIEFSGTGANGPNFNGFTAAGNATVGYFFTDALELSLKQSAAYSDFAGVGWSGSTRAAIDLNVPLGDDGEFVPYIGVNGGYVYGNNGLHNWEAAPEAGLKIFVNSTTFIFVSAEYQFSVDQHSDNGSTLSNQIRKGEFVYGAGVGWRF